MEFVLRHGWNLRTLCSEISQIQRTSDARFHLHEAPKVDRFVETERMMASRGYKGVGFGAVV